MRIAWRSRTAACDAVERAAAIAHARVDAGLDPADARSAQRLRGRGRARGDREPRGIGENARRRDRRARRPIDGGPAAAAPQAAARGLRGAAGRRHDRLDLAAPPTSPRAAGASRPRKRLPNPRARHSSPTSASTRSPACRASISASCWSTAAACRRRASRSTCRCSTPDCCAPGTPRAARRCGRRSRNTTRPSSTLRATWRRRRLAREQAAARARAEDDPGRRRARGAGQRLGASAPGNHGRAHRSLPPRSR